jgi:dTDP-4-amino-4,6-dideoxygalactose transaminase
MSDTFVPTFQGLAVREMFAPPFGRATFPFAAARHLRCFRARHAVYHLFRALVAERGALAVLVPDYNSGSEVMALRAAGAAVHFVPVGRDTVLDPERVERCCAERRVDALYVIHYFGWPQPMTALTEICRRRQMLLVEDCALALFSSLDDRPLGSFGDFSIFCLYKTLPVPNGAVLVQNRSPLAALDRVRWRTAGIAPVAGRLAELAIARVRGRTARVGRALQHLKRLAGRASTSAGCRRVPIGDIGFDPGHVDLAMSAFSAHLACRLDPVAIRTRRAANFRSLASAIAERATLLAPTLDPGVCPLVCPLLVPNKPAAAAALRDRDIEPLEIWNAGDPATAPGESEAARFLRRHVLGLPVHQDLTARQIDHMVTQVTRLDLRMPA